ncbi:hypothetical protein ACXHP8_08650 [Vibrio antiquarius]|jgi:hypothetical protein
MTKNDYDAYQKRLTSIHMQLQEIADEILILTLINAADMSNQNILNLINRQKKLFNESRKIIDILIRCPVHIS